MAENQCSQPSSAGEAKRILILEDDRAHYIINKEYLQEDITHSYRIFHAETLQQAELLIREEDPFDGILVDYMLPDGTGLDFIRRLKSMSLERTPALVLLTSQGNTTLAVQAMKEGANDYLEKGDADMNALGRVLRSAIHNAELQHQLKESRQKLEERALHDPLTGMPNRTLFQDRCETAIQMCRRSGNRIAFLALDFDKFKEINDSYGHDAGDAVLVAISKRIMGSLRGTDTLARLGGDEFCILLQGLVAPEGVHPVINRIKGIVQSNPVGYQDISIPVSLSIGVSVYPEDGTTYEELMKAADIRLYDDKETRE